MKNVATIPDIHRCSPLALSRAAGVALMAVMATTASGGILSGPYVQNPTTNAVTIMWEADVDTTGTVSCALATDDSVTRSVVAAAPERLAEKSFWYAATLTQLRPGAGYTYRVALGDLPPEDGTFRTFPARPAPLTFIVVGDTHGRSFNGGIPKDIAAHNPDLIIHTGDLTNDGNKLEQWRDGIFQSLGYMLRHVPIYPARGNHDGSPDRLPAFFSLPGDELNYSFDFGNTHFICIDERAPDQAKVLKWCEQDLAASTSLWKIAWFHHPIFNIADHGYTSKRDTYLPLFERYGVAMTRCGHSHLYERFRPMAMGSNGDPRAIIHVVSGGGGGEMDHNPKVKSHPDLATNYPGFHYSVIHIDGPTLTSTTYGFKDGVVDSFTITRRPDGRFDDTTMARAIDRRTDPLFPAGDAGHRTSGRFGRAYSFGDSQPLALDPKGRFNDEQGSFEFWVKMGGEGASGGTWLHVEADRPTRSYHHIQRDKLMNAPASGATNKVYGVAYETCADGRTNRLFVPLLQDGWSHVMARYDAKARKMYLCVNGKKEVSAPYHRTACAAAPRIGIGGFCPKQEGWAEFAWGPLDELRISTRLRKPQRQTAPHAPDTGTLTLLHFDEDEGNWPADNAAPARLLTHP